MSNSRYDEKEDGGPGFVFLVLESRRQTYKKLIIIKGS